MTHSEKCGAQALATSEGKPKKIYLLPRYIHKLMANSPSLGTLHKIDYEIKLIIKHILHLHSSTTDGIIYSKRSHGDLGVQRVANIVKLTKLNSIQMIRSEDITTKRVFDQQEEIIRKYTASIGLLWLCELDEIEHEKD